MTSFLHHAPGKAHGHVHAVDGSASSPKRVQQ
jgi:hypothetical protein